MLEIPLSFGAECKMSDTFDLDCICIVDRHKLRRHIKATLKSTVAMKQHGKICVHTI